MRIHQLKVRPKKSLLSAPCSAELAALLACWASTDSVMGAPVLGVGSVPKVGGAGVGGGAAGGVGAAGMGTHGACANAMKGLEECMRRAATAPRAKARPAINYHLAKWGKQL